MADPKIIDKSDIGGGSFVRIKSIDWQDSEGAPHKWESAERENDNGAVCMIPRLSPSRRYVCIKQFRPPLGGWVIEFPAGLIDKGEDAEQAALRELKEETGYTGTITYLTNPSCSSPGLTNELVRLAFVDIDENAPENQNPRPSPESSEHIEVFALLQNEVLPFFRKEMDKGVRIDSKVVAFAIGHLYGRAESADSDDIFGDGNNSTVK